MFGDSLTLFEASAHIEASLRDLTTLGTVLDSAIQAGATGLGRIHYEADGMEEARHEALASALSQARADAEAIAMAAGGTLGPLVSVTSDQQFPLMGRFVGGYSFSGPSLDIAPTSVSVGAVVSAEWQMMTWPESDD